MTDRTAAERQRRHRERSRDGVRVVQNLELTQQQIDALVSEGWIAPGATNDLGAAIADLLECWTEGRLRSRHA
jgi:hypothetical protein